MIKKIEGFNIPSDHYVKVIDCNNIKEVIYIDILSHNLMNYKRIGKDKMLNLVTGEVIDIDGSVTRRDNIKSLRETIKRLRRLINANFEGVDNELFITLTYAENMTDYKRLYGDFKKFYQKLKRKYKDIEFRYISVIEPQERGAWHIHLLLKALNRDYLFIDNDSVISELWGHGFTKTKRLNVVDNVGAYLTAYLIDLVDDEGRKKKGARLYLYPAGVNIYRCSRNCRKPIERWVEYGEIDYKNCKTFELVYEILDDKGNYCNVVKKEFYNLRRSKMVYDGTYAGKGGL